MIKDLKSILSRSGHLMLQDLAGTALLVALMAMALHLPLLG